MKNAVITLNYNYKTNLYYDFLRRKVIPTIESYAYRIGADFICMDNKAEKYYKTWNQLQFIEYFDVYDKICYVDGDVLIKNDFKENIFSYSDDNSVGLTQFYNKNNQCHNLFVIMTSSKKIWNDFKLPSLENQKRIWNDPINDIPVLAADYCDKYKDDVFLACQVTHTGISTYYTYQYYNLGAMSVHGICSTPDQPKMTLQSDCRITSSCLNDYMVTCN